jgi:uncharacterized membrane protein
LEAAVGNKIRFYLNRLRERLWVKPFLMCLLSLASIWLANLADDLPLESLVPEVSIDSVESLLTILSSGMLVIATLAVTSMVSSYNSASTTATPRAFPLVIADDHSQFALSTFVGAFIFSVVTLVVVQNHYYGKAGLFAVFTTTLFVFTVVILTFVRWMDCIARLGLLGNTVKKIEDATECALLKRRESPTMGGLCLSGDVHGQPIYHEDIGYIQLIDMEALQAAADKHGVKVAVQALPGTFVTPNRVLARLIPNDGRNSADHTLPSEDLATFARGFVIGRERTFDEDPRFGLVSLSQVASRALSPAVNDPGTAIDILSSCVRLLLQWATPAPEAEKADIRYDRVAVPKLSLDDLFDDAFAAIGRDGAGLVEVAVRVQKALAALAATGGTVKDVAHHQARQALARAENALSLAEDIDTVRGHCPACEGSGLGV